MSDPQIEADVYFAIVPEWVVFCGNARAIQIYAILARHTNTDRTAFPGRSRIAKLADCSPDTVDRALDVLVEIGALSKERRQKEDGSYETNLYRLFFSPPAAHWKQRVSEGVVAPMRLPTRAGAEGGGRTGAEQTRASSNESQQPDLLPTSPAREERDTDPYWDTLERVFGYRPANASSERALWGKIVKLVMEVGDPPDEIERRAALWMVGAVWEDRDKPPRLTPGALLKHYQWLGSRLASASTTDLDAWRKEYKRQSRREQLEGEENAPRNAGAGS
jgi:hypothetical protein